MNIKEENDDYIVVEFTSSAGNPYEVGYPKAAGYRSETILSQLESAASQSKDVANGWQAINWVPAGDSSTSRGAVTIGIVGGFVNQAASYIIYKYQVYFSNYTGWSFTFKDASGDTYTCSTAVNGNHYINYNSSAATMVGVQ